MKTIQVGVLCILLSACTASQVEEVEKSLDAVERHAITAEVGILTEATELGIQALQRLHDETGTSLDRIRETLETPAQ